MKFKENEFNLNLTISKYSPFLRGIISPSNISFVYLELFKIVKKINSGKESFLNGDFGKIDDKIFTVSNGTGCLNYFIYHLWKF